ncbi:MAG: hypothetical protein Q8O03_03980 [Nanoarchaeota archaeon]|nr:hypothetical protein [Nanoarchaeota archaeon]
MEKKNKLIVADKGWLETAPEWLIENVKKERQLSAITDLRPDAKEEVGDAEMCLYLYTLSLKMPMTAEMTKIYMYLCNKLLKQKDIEIPDGIKIDGLEEYEEKELDKLKHELWVKRGGRIHTPVTDAMAEAFKKTKKRKNTE